MEIHMARKMKTKGYQVTQPKSIVSTGMEIKKDYFTVYQERMEKLLKQYPTTVVSYFKKDDVIGTLKKIAASFQPTPDDFDLSINIEVKVGDLLYDIGRFLSLSDNELVDIVGNEKFEELSR
jgi:hypothetical protein